MTIITKTCIEPYIDSFMRCFAEANYKHATIKEYCSATITESGRRQL